MIRYISIPDASSRVKRSTQDFVNLVQRGIINAVMIGEDIYLEERAVMAQHSRSEFAHLEGKPISISEASRRYGIAHQTIIRWRDKGYIRVLGTDKNRILLDESDVAFSAANYRADPGQGKWTRRKSQ